MLSKQDLFSIIPDEFSGYYELSIQVNENGVTNPFLEYSNYWWNQDDVEGPYDVDFNPIPFSPDQTELNGILTLGNVYLPFKISYYQWIWSSAENVRSFKYSISFSSEHIELVFGEEHKVWKTAKNSPLVLQIQLEKTLRKLYQIYPFEIAVIGFEIRELATLELLIQGTTDDTDSSFYVDPRIYATINDDCKHRVNQLQTAVSPVPDAANQSNTRLLSEIVWNFDAEYYPTKATFNETVNEYQRKILGENAKWNPDQIVIDQPTVHVFFNRWTSNGSHEERGVILKSDNFMNFSALELMHAIHNELQLGGYDLGDHVFFQGLEPRADHSTAQAKYKLLCGS